VAFWAVALWAPVDPRNVVGACAAAATTSLAAVACWLARWLGGRGMVFLLDAMLTQRAWYRRRLGVSGPLRAARHAR
jgi:hypothetical protein